MVNKFCNCSFCKKQIQKRKKTLVGFIIFPQVIEKLRINERNLKIRLEKDKNVFLSGFFKGNLPEKD